MTAAPTDRASRAPARIPSALKAALPSWITARVLVTTALGIARLLVDRGRVDDPLARVTVSQGLLAWDGSFYADIARSGYAALPREALRFFPLTPMLGRAVGWIGVGPRIGVAIVANAAALAAGALLWTLVRREGFGADAARRSVWLLALMPAAFVLVLGYAEAVFLACAIGVFIAARDKRWLIAALLGVLAGLSRPAGFVVAVPIAIEAARSLSTTRPSEVVRRVLAVLAPFAGTGLFLWWVDGQFGDALLPFRVQTRANLKGSFTNPVASVSHAMHGLFHGHIGTGLHIPWMVVAASLVVVCFRRLPASYGWFALITLASAVTSHNLDSFERYALSAFPLVIAVALIADRTWLERSVLTVSAVAMTAYATLAFLHVYVP